MLKDKKKRLLGGDKQKGQKMIANKYEVKKIIGQGVSSTVIEAIDQRSQRRVAIKKIKQFLENKHESLRILRQIILLRRLQHPNIVSLHEILIENENCKELSLVLEYFPTDIKGVFKSNQVLTLQTIKEIILQLLSGLNYCQQCQVLHRDLKPQNILVTQDFSQVKLCDFGLARAVLTEDVHREDVHRESKMVEEKDKAANNNNLTAHVATRWYRAPELILLQRKYNNAIDMWAVGCIIGELLCMLKENAKTFMDRKPLFPGKACYPLSPPKGPEMNYKKVNDFPHSVYDQLSVIFGIIGTPSDISFITDQRAKNYIKSFGKMAKKPFKEIYKYIPEEVEDFLEKSLKFNPNERMTVEQAIKHPLFDDIRDKYTHNINLKGQPINMDLEALSLEEIEELVIKECSYYTDLAKNEMDLESSNQTNH